MCALNGGLNVFHIALNVGSCHVLGIGFALQQDGLRQGFEPLLACHLRASTAFGLIRQVYIFERGAVPSVVDTAFQFGSKLAQLVNCFANGFLALCKFSEFVFPLADIGNLHLVQSACFLFTITADKRDGAALVQQCEGVCHFGLV